MTQMYKAPNTCVSVEYVVVGMLSNNVYIISDGASTIVVDPTTKVDEILAAVGDRGVDAIVITHRHFDHVGVSRELRERTGALVIASEVDAPVIEGKEPLPRGDRHLTPCPVDHYVNDGDILQIGNTPWKIIGTPGHTQGGICLYVTPELGTNPEGAPVLVAGDTLFAGAIGRVDFEGGSITDMKKSLKRLAILPDNTVVLPGHGELTTIGNERGRVFAHYA